MGSRHVGFCQVDLNDEKGKVKELEIKIKLIKDGEENKVKLMRRT